MSWRELEDYPGYEVSDSGDVRSYHRTKDGPRILKPSIGNHGRRVVVLKNKEGKRKQLLVYRLVLSAFRGPCPKGMEACHNDGNPQNDNLENLRWDTNRGNQRDKKKHGTDIGGERHPLAKLTWDKVEAIRFCSDLGVSQRKLSFFFEVDQSQISNIIHRKAWV